MIGCTESMTAVGGILPDAVPNHRRRVVHPRQTCIGMIIGETLLYSDMVLLAEGAAKQILLDLFLKIVLPERGQSCVCLRVRQFHLIDPDGLADREGRIGKIIIIITRIETATFGIDEGGGR